jgi:hypothetical protein
LIGSCIVSKLYKICWIMYVIVTGGTVAALESELEALRPTSSGEEELQLQLALAMSKEEHEEELRRLKGDEAKLQMAIDESRKQAVVPSPSHVRGDGSVRPASENVCPNVISIAV